MSPYLPFSLGNTLVNLRRLLRHRSVRGRGAHRQGRDMVSWGECDDDVGAGAGRRVRHRRPPMGGRSPGRWHHASSALLVGILVACRVAEVGASPKLSALSFNGDVATLSPTFDPDTLSYNANVSTDRTSLQLDYTVLPETDETFTVATTVAQPSGKRRALLATTSALAICPGAQRHIPDGHADIRRRGDDVRGASHELLPGLARLTPRPGAQHRLNRGATRWTRLPRAHALVRRHRGLHRNGRVHHPNRGVRVQVHDDRRRGVARLGAIQAQRRRPDV